jgi:hypothetical protein
MGLNLYTQSLRDAGADRADDLVRIQNANGQTSRHPREGKPEWNFACRVSEPPSSLLIDIVVERKRNADGVCPCGFRVIGNEETNVDSVFK